MTERDITPDQPQEKEPSVERGDRHSLFALNGIILLLISVVGYLSYAFISQRISDSYAEQQKVAAPPLRIIQLDVLNGSGVKGVASKFTSYLRSNGFDVVEMKNYKSSDLLETLVLDRVGDLTSARRVATALGVNERHIIQQLNPDYFVDVSVVIGKDFSHLKPLQ